MRTLRRRLLCAVALQYLAGCAALIARSGTDEAELIRAGMTEAQLSQRLGPPIRAGELSPPQRAIDLWKSDRLAEVYLIPKALWETKTFN